ncbi:MAG: hypothetical protein RL434_1747 [Pseudomonadota bacterium]|jgi:uncharacterized protein (DUF4213/DUF364 family)
MILDECLDLAAACVARLGPRRIVQAWVPEPHPDPARDAEFGLLTLEDGSAGLYYAWLGGAQQHMANRFPTDMLAGRDALELAMTFRHGDDAARSLAVAALNALTASFWRAVAYVPPPATDSFGLCLKPAGRLGMVGNFPSLVRQARALGIAVTVLERKAHMVIREPGLEITLDPTALAGCDQILCTAATLLNDTLDEVLGFCTPGAEVAVVGPTAGVLPEPLFARGVAVVGGTLIKDAAEAARRLAAGQKLGDTGYRYRLTRDPHVQRESDRMPGDYPGTRVLCLS